MRVVHVSAYFPPAFSYGGPPASVLGLCRGLQRAGVDVEVVTTTANGRESLRPSPPGGERYDGVPVHYAARAAAPEEGVRALPAARPFPRGSPGPRTREPLREALATADVCHIHGVWN